MVYAAILAGGKGSRMQSDIPKQYLEINGKAVLLYSIEAFAANKSVDAIIIAVSEEYFDYTKDMLKQLCPNIEATVITGGSDRTATLKNILKHLAVNNMLDAESILLTHDAARPFVDERIISENIEAAKSFGACNTVVPAVDTIIESTDGEFITAVPARKNLYNVQTPQSFNAKKLYELTMSLTPEECSAVTDACSIFVMRGEKVRIVSGKPENIKITYPSDLSIADKLIKEG